jgi:hypothetical protein
MLSVQMDGFPLLLAMSEKRDQYLILTSGTGNGSW